MFLTRQNKADAFVAQQQIEHDINIVTPKHLLKDIQLLLNTQKNNINNRKTDITLFDENSIKSHSAKIIVSLFLDFNNLNFFANDLLNNPNNSTCLIIACLPQQMVELGNWLNKKAEEKNLKGIQLIVASSIQEVINKIPEYLSTLSLDKNVIYLPVATGVENAGFKNFFVFSPAMQDLLFRMKSLADNGISRVCLLGGPGIGKTSLAYFYYTVRNLGQFIAVNLAAENTGDKSAIKSLLCGHVSGAFPGAGSRNGAFSQARDGVCFLDESHQISGAVMEVLMEALEGQYMPYGASAKRPMECALLYATNRSWEHLMNSVNLDEFTRMGASVVKIPELYERKEDLIAVVASTLANFSKKCKSWEPPVGLTPEAWNILYNCRWRGNVRGLIRVLETAFENTAIKTLNKFGKVEINSNLIQDKEVLQGIKLWEPETHHSYKIYYQENTNEALAKNQ